jgi:hypothetical protein
MLAMGEDGEYIVKSHTVFALSFFISKKWDYLPYAGLEPALRRAIDHAPSPGSTRGMATASPRFLPERIFFREKGNGT